MNLFILSRHHETNARYHADKHVVKMVVESAQLLSTVMRERCDIDFGYKSTYINHPVTRWVGASFDNFIWTWKYGCHLADEYAYRFVRYHKTGEVLDEMECFLDQVQGILPNIGLTPFHLAVSPELKHLAPVLAYRAYYLRTKKRLFKWTKRQVPSWIVDPPYELRDYL